MTRPLAAPLLRFLQGRSINYGMLGLTGVKKPFKIYEDLRNNFRAILCGKVIVLDVALVSARDFFFVLM